MSVGDSAWEGRNLVLPGGIREPVPLRLAGDLATALSTLEVTGQPLKIPISGVKLNLAVRHTRMGDLRIKLMSPSRNNVTIWNRAGGTQDDLVLTDFLLPGTSKINPNGIWTLSVQDSVTGEIGNVESWSLTFPDFQNPYIWITSPIGGSVTTSSSQVYVSGRAADDRLVERVQVRLAGAAKWQNVSLSKTTGAWSKSISLSSPGTFTYEFRALDESGLVSETAVLTIIKQ